VALSSSRTGWSYTMALILPGINIAYDVGIYIYRDMYIYVGYKSPYLHAEHIPFHMATFIQVLTESHMRNFD